MATLAVDVVLLPPEDIMDKAIELNQKLLKKDDRNMVLHKENCLPHISLAMGCLDEKDLPKIREILEEIAQQFSPLRLQITRTYVKEPKPTGEISPGLEIEKTRELQLLHETVTKRLSVHFTYETTKEMFVSPPEIQEFALGWVKNYHKKVSSGNFSPHITLGSFDEPEKLDKPITFTASKLALCHLGDHCTCRKLLATTMLKK